jgi:hypothetical protein
MTAPSTERIQELEREIAELRALFDRTVVRGVPRQEVEDRLRELERQLREARAFASEWGLRAPR